MANRAKTLKYFLVLKEIYHISYDIIKLNKTPPGGADAIKMHFEPPERLKNKIYFNLAV